MIIPTIKTLSLDPNEFSNCRPIFNLPFLSKLIEKVAVIQLDQHITINNFYPTMQSGYRKFQSTEASLILIFNDIGCSIDKITNAVLLLLNLSSAFDTVEHKILLKRFKMRLGLPGKVRKWIKSLLSR